MKLLHVVPSYLPATRYGGPIYSVHALCAALVRLGHAVEVFTTNVDGPGVSPVPVGAPVDVDGVKVTYFATGLGRRLYRSPAMGRALAERAKSFDVLHLHSVFLWPTTAAARAARRSAVPYLMSPRGMLVSDLIRRKSSVLKTGWITLFDRRNLANAAAVHVTSEVEADEFRRLQLPSREIVVIPNGLDAPSLTTSEGGKANAEPTVLCLGRISWKKGLDRLIAAMARVERGRLIIAGNDEEGYRPRLEAHANKLGLSHRIEFRGPVHGDEKWRLLATADVFALASYSENFGNVVLEAMTCGVPVVVTPEVGLAPAVRAAEAGIVVEGDAVPLGSAIAGLLDDPRERRRLGENGRKCVAEQFSWPAIARAMSEVYARAVVGRCAGPASP
ncbi:MAG: glycosyltransferase [Hyphomicrobiaceae bacterium]|nr:MAG: glycosyltransferase [Hyphomicrobiaceae bacterium]